MAHPPIIAVADGVGGSAKGEVASRRALDAFRAHVVHVATAPTSREAQAEMTAAVLAANEAVFEAQLLDDSLRGMATTLTGACIRHGGEVVVGHAGDSRLYLISAEGARQLTHDHSVVAELVRTGRLDAADVPQHPQRNTITRALGPEPQIEVDAFVVHVGPGDWLLACSDGLTEHVTDPEIARLVLDLAADPDAAVGALVDLANERGGTDNISVAIAQPLPITVSGELSLEAIDAAARAPTDGGDDPAGLTMTLRAQALEQAQAQASSPAPMPAPSPAAASGASGHAEGSGATDSMLAPFEAGVDTPPATDATSLAARARQARRGRSIAIAALVLVIALAGGGFIWSQSYVLVVRDDGRVGIDQGFPGVGLSSPHRTSNVLESELTPADMERLIESGRILSRDDAERLLDELPERVEPAGEVTDRDPARA